MHGEGEAIAIQLTHPIIHNNARVMTPQTFHGLEYNKAMNKMISRR